MSHLGVPNRQFRTHKIVLVVHNNLNRPKLCELCFPNILFTKMLVHSYHIHHFRHVLWLIQENTALIMHDQPFTLSCISNHLKIAFCNNCYACMVMFYVSIHYNIQYFFSGVYPICIPFGEKEEMLKEKMETSFLAPKRLF